MGRRATTAIFCTVLVLSLVPASSGSVSAADNTQPVELAGGGSQFLITADSQFVISRSDQLYAIPIDGGTPVRLDNLGMNPSDWYRVTPDSSTVVFGQSESASGYSPTQLYSVPIQGGIPTRLTPDLAADGATLVPELSPDGSRVVFWLLRGADETEIDIHSVQLDGDSLVKLNDPFFFGPEPAPVFMVSDNSSHVVYFLDQDTYQVSEIYSVPIAGGPTVKLNDSLVDGGAVSDGWVMSGSNHVVYGADQVTDEQIEIYAVPLTGGTPWKLNRALAADEDANLEQVTIADGSQIIYSITTDPDGPKQWYSVPVTGGSSNLITPAMRPSIESTADSSYFVYMAESGGTYSVPVAGGAATKLSDNSSFAVLPDSSRVLVWVEEGGEYQLDAIPVEGGYPTVVVGATSLSQPSTIVTQDSRRVVYRADIDGDGSRDLMSIPVGGGSPLELGSGLTSGPWRISADSSRVVYSADPDGLGVRLFSSVLTRSPVPHDVTWSVSEDTLPGTVVGVVDALDPDGDPLAYSLLEPNTLFEIDSEGVVTLTGSLDYVTATSHEFVVEVSDGIFTDTANVTVNVTEVPAGTTTTTLPSTTTTVPPTTTTTLPSPDFDDVPDISVFHGDITWLATQGITKGCNPPINDTFCPDHYVTRGQMAAFLHRALGDTLPAAAAVSFTDDDGSIFEADIEWLASVAVTHGCNPPDSDKFCPNAFVTRGQMAAFLDRALDLAEPVDPDLFVDDDGTVFEAQIDRLATAGITRGCNPPINDMFCPDQPVTRAQMAAFLHRAIG